MKFRRALCFLVILILVLSGCGNSISDVLVPLAVPTSEPTTPPTSESTAPPTEASQNTDPEPTTEPALPVDYSAYESLLSGASLSGTAECTYSVYDLNDDGIRELIIKTGNCEADFIYHFYSLDEVNNLVELGIFSGSHSVLFANVEEPGIIHLSAHMGYQTVTLITLEGSNLITTMLEEGYAGDRYYQNPNHLTVCPVTDHSLLAETAQLIQYVEIIPEPPRETNPVPYLLKVNRWDQPIYDGPGYEYTYVGIVNGVGTYTIMEEAWDAAGNLWGKLKSGAGWIDITDANTYPSNPDPFTAEFAEETAPLSGDYHHCIADTSEYMVQVVFRANRVLTNFRLVRLQLVDTGYAVSEELFYTPKLIPSVPLLADISFPGDLSAYGIIFEDSSGTEQKYIIGTSGLDGSLWVGKEHFFDFTY